MAVEWEPWLESGEWSVWHYHIMLISAVKLHSNVKQFDKIGLNFKSTPPVTFECMFPEPSRRWSSCPGPGTEGDVTCSALVAKVNVVNIRQDFIIIHPGPADLHCTRPCTVHCTSVLYSAWSQKVHFRNTRHVLPQYIYFRLEYYFLWKLKSFEYFSWKKNILNINREEGDSKWLKCNISFSLLTWYQGDVQWYCITP